MTRTESQRAQPRVEYAAEVNILRPGGRTPIRARSLNLSPTGVFVEAEPGSSADVPVGTRLLCDIPLPGGRRYLKGTVARLQAMPSHGTGLGIRFDNLEAADQAILHALVQNGADHSHLVKVRFEGMPEALRSRAVVTKEGLRLQTALPFLRLTSAVDVSFIAGDSRIQTYGTLEKVHLEPQPTDGIPRLAVDVALAEPLSAEEEFLHTATPRTGEFGPEFGSEDSAVTEFGDDAPTRRDPLPAAMSLAQSPTTPTLVLHKTAAAEAQAETTPAPGRIMRRRTPTRIRERRAAPTAQTPVASRLGDAPAPDAPTAGEMKAACSTTRLAPNPWWWVWGWPVLACVLATAIIYDRMVVASRVDSHLVEQGHAIESTRQAVVEAAALARQAKGAAEATQAATLGLRSAIRHEVGAALETRSSAPSREPGRTSRSAAAPADKVEPALRINGDTAVASVPITGTTDQMIQYSLKNPSGVVVKLPNARSLVPDGHYWLRSGGFKVVWVEQRAEGLVLRFVYDNSMPRQEMLEVIEAGPDVETAAQHPAAAGSVRVRLRKA